VPVIKKFIPFIILSSIAIIAFSQLWFHANAMAFDMADYFLPNRYFAGECLQAGIFPWWNPYSGLGIPFHADPQSGAFYPVVWFIGYFFGYNFFTINCEYLLHVILAGAGMYLLMHSISKSIRIALLIAICYELSGIFVGNAQHLTWIISAAWLPWVIYFWLKMNSEKKVINTLAAAFFLMMMTTGGYPGYIIVLLYIFLVATVIFLVGYLMQKKFIELRNYLLLLFLFLAAYVLLTAPYIFSILNALPYFTRAEALTAGHISFVAFTPISTISFLFPAATISNIQKFVSDASMINGYMGLLPLILLIAIFFTHQEKKVWVVFTVSCLMLLISFGNNFFVWDFAFNYVPLINRIRFPSLFRGFSITGFLITAGMVMSNTKNSSRYFTASIFLLFLVLAFALSSFLIGNEKLLPQAFSISALKIFFEQSTISNNILLQSVIQIPVLIVFILIFWKGKKFKKSPNAFVLLFIVGMEMILATKINLPVTIASGVKVKSLNLKLKEQPKGFPINLENKLSDVVHEGDGTFAPSYFNNNVFKKQFSYTSYNPFDLKSKDSLDIFPLSKQLLKHPIAFVNNNLQKYPQNISDTSFQLHQNAILVSNKMARSYLSNSKDSLWNKIEIIAFNPNHFSFQTKTNEIAFLNLLQNFYPGWKASINQKPTYIHISNYSTMLVVIAPGTNNVEFNYEPGIIKWLLYLSVASQAILLLILIYLKSKKVDLKLL
jgi:hypothetical protein